MSPDIISTFVFDDCYCLLMPLTPAAEVFCDRLERVKHGRAYAIPPEARDSILSSARRAGLIVEEPE